MTAMDLEAAVTVAVLARGWFGFVGDVPRLVRVYRAWRRWKSLA